MYQCSEKIEILYWNEHDLEESFILHMRRDWHIDTEREGRERKRDRER